MKKYGVIIILLMLCLIFWMVACNNLSGNVETKRINTTSIDSSNTQKNGGQINTNVQGQVSVKNEQHLKDFVLKFVKAIKNNEYDTFIKMVGEDGIISINYFVDKRDPTTVIHVYKNNIRDDLVLVNSEKRVGVTLQTLVADISESDLYELPINSSNISFNVDWRLKDERKIAYKVEEIVKTCQEINLINNKYIPQVFMLKDNYYAFVIGSGVLEPKVEFIGNWVIFEKIGYDYIIHAVLQFQ